MITIDAPLAYYKVKNDAELSRRVSVTREAISKWRSGVLSCEHHAIFQVISKNEPIADLYKHSNAKSWS